MTFTSKLPAALQTIAQRIAAQSLPRRIAGAGALALLAVAIFSASTHDVEANVNTAAEPQPLLLVEADLVTAETGTVAQGVKITGTLEPLQQTTVHARVNAVLDAVLVREGERVTQGQVLARQNRADVAAQLEQARAQYTSASIELKLVEALENRKKELFEKKYLSDADWAAAQGDTEVRRATLKVREAQLEIAKRSADDALIIAPISGIIAQRHVEPGSNLSPGQVVMTLVNLDTLELAAAIPARDIPRIRIGNAVTFTVDGYPGETFKGTIARINPMANGGSRTITVYARVDNRNGKLRGGMFASGRVLVESTASAAVRMPYNAVRHIEGKDQAWVIRNNTLVLQPLTLGVRDSGSGLVEVRAGIAAGERVVLAEIGKRTSGMPVTITAAGSEPGKETIKGTEQPIPTQTQQ